MNDKKLIMEELETMQQDYDQLSEIWEKLTANTTEDGDILVPESDAIQISIILGF